MKLIRCNPSSRVRTVDLFVDRRKLCPPMTGASGAFHSPMNVEWLVSFLFDFALDLHPASQSKQARHGGSHAFLAKSQSSLQPRTRRWGLLAFYPTPQVIIRAPKGNDNLQALRVLRYHVCMHCIYQRDHTASGLASSSHPTDLSEARVFTIWISQSFCAKEPDQNYPNSPTESSQRSQPAAGQLLASFSFNLAKQPPSWALSTIRFGYASRGWH